MSAHFVRGEDVCTLCSWRRCLHTLFVEKMSAHFVRDELLERDRNYGVAGSPSGGSQSGGSQSAFGASQSAFGASQSAFGGAQSAFGGAQSAFGG
jgi:hypothetical protein